MHALYELFVYTDMGRTRIGLVLSMDKNSGDIRLESDRRWDESICAMEIMSKCYDVHGNVLRNNLTKIEFGGRTLRAAVPGTLVNIADISEYNGDDSDENELWIAIIINLQSTIGHWLGFKYGECYLDYYTVEDEEENEVNDNM